jgi:hypothetical protein
MSGRNISWNSYFEGLRFENVNFLWLFETTSELSPALLNARHFYPEEKQILSYCSQCSCHRILILHATTKFYLQFHSTAKVTAAV